MARKLVPRIVAKLAKYLAGPDWCEDVVGHILDEDVGASVAELASGERVDGDAFPSWSCGCLLYTSPSPRDGLLSRMPSSA